MQQWGRTGMLALVFSLLPLGVWAGKPITLTWEYLDNGTEPITGFRIERSTDNQVSWQLRARNQGELTWTDKAVPKIAVCYRVRAYNDTQWSEPSNVVCLTPPTAPTSLQGTQPP